MTDSCLAPVALFVYARPDHAQRTLEALSRNYLATKTLLYIFADGPRADASRRTIDGIREVRRIIHQRQWCSETRIIESEINSGLANSIVRGVTQVCQQHNKVIVLEDDLETSPGFLRYMNDALNIYAGDEKIMQVSGFNVRNWPWVSKTGFLRVSTSWGWATWQRAWQHYQSDAASLINEVRSRDARAFDLDGHSFHLEELEKNTDGRLHTWAVKWYASIFLRDGLCLYPRKTLVRNLGFDGSGENCYSDSRQQLRRMPLCPSITVRRQQISESKPYLHAMQRHFDSELRRWTGTRFRDRLQRRLRRLFRAGIRVEHPKSELRTP